MKTLPELFREAYSDARAAGLPVPPFDKISILYNMELGRVWGHASKRGADGFMIKLSRTLCHDTTENAILNTMIHELVHCSGAWGHTGLFRTYARAINVRFPEKYNVKRCTSPQDKMSEEKMREVYRYIVECPECHHLWTFNKMSRVVRHPEDYSCPTCNRKHRKAGDGLRSYLVRIK